jgi:hypothetical protein
VNMIKRRWRRLRLRDNGVVRNGLIWLRIGTTGRLLGTR